MADISIDGFCHCATVSSSRNGGTVAEDARSHFDRGIAWARIGAYEQALEAWRQALQLTPDLPDAYAAIGSVYMTLGCWQEAVRSYQQAVRANPYLLESYYGLGSAYGRLGEYRLAIEAYEQAFQRIPLEHDQNSQADDVCLECAAVGELRLDPNELQDRLRSDTEGFDFSALLSGHTARRFTVRQPQTAK